MALTFPMTGPAKMAKYRNFSNSYTNSKSEAPNSVSCRTLDVRHKQIQIIEIQNSIQKNIRPVSCLKHLGLEFNDCLGFSPELDSRLNLGFNQEIAKFIMSIICISPFLWYML